MTSIRISKERWYLTQDKTRVVPEEDPEAAFLLVGKGAEISPAVAEKYGIETVDAVAVAVVPRDLNAEREAMITPGTSADTVANYDRMIATRDANMEVAKAVTTAGNPSTSRQASLMVDGLVNERVGTSNDGTAGVLRSADSTGGKGGAPVDVAEGETGAVDDPAGETGASEPTTRSRTRNVGGSGGSKNTGEES